jgi:hypothetical protein
VSCRKETQEEEAKPADSGYEKTEAGVCGKSVLFEDMAMKRDVLVRCIDRRLAPLPVEDLMPTESDFYDAIVRSGLLSSIFHSVTMVAEVVLSKLNCVSLLLLNSDYEVID